MYFQNTSYDAVTKREAFHVFDNTINNGYDVIYDYRAVSEFKF